MKKIQFLILIFITSFCYSQTEINYKKLKRKSNVRFEKTVTENILKLESSDLSYFISLIKKDFDLKPFNKVFIEKAKIANYGFDISILINLLIEQNTEKRILEDILNSKKAVWDKGNWSQKIWKLILEQKLDIKTENEIYKINQFGEKEYDIANFLKQKIELNEIGLNPMLQIDNQIVSYENNELEKTLREIIISNIDVMTKDKSVNLFGKKGIDGVIQITTKK